MGKTTHIMPQAKKQTCLIEEYILSDRCEDLEILMTGGLKPEYYNCERIFKCFDF